MTLYEALPDKLEHRGKEYRMFASFDRVLEAMSFLKRKDFSGAEKEEYLTFLLFGDGVEPDFELLFLATFLALKTTSMPAGMTKTYRFKRL